VDKQRTLVSNLVVYQSRFDPTVLSEYRIPLTVDGKPTGKPEQAAMKLFGRLARARSTAEELEIMKEQNMSHGLGAVVSGIALYPLGVIRADLRDRFEFSLQGTASLDGREATILDYREKTPRRVEPRSMGSQFAEPWIVSNGRVWLDASDHRLRRRVGELVVSDTTLPGPGVVERSESDYTDSAFGILVRRLVWERYRKSGRKNGPQALRLAVRLTHTYSDFKRFDVTTDSDIRLPTDKE
jgi:hypothetical protein